MSSSPRSDTQKILQLIGAIVLVSQDAERYLKITLPFIGPAAAPHREITKQLERLQKRTLGDLTGKFVDSTNSHSLDFAQHMDYLVDTRNKVVHHFCETYGAQLNSGAHQEVINVLATIHANLKGFRSVLEQIALVVLEGLREVTFRDTPEYEQFAMLCASFRQNIPSTKVSGNWNLSRLA